LGAWIAAAALAFLLDQGSKRWLAKRVPPGERRSFCGLVTIRVQWTDDPRPWGSPKRWLLVAWFAAAVVSAFVLASSGFVASHWAQAGLGAAIGGAAGNLLDRIRLRAVVDFIDIGLGSLFNLADVFILAGLGLVLMCGDYCALAAFVGVGT